MAFEVYDRLNPLLDENLEISSNLKRAWFVSLTKMSSILFNDFYKNVFSSTISFSLVLFLMSISSLFIKLYCCVRNWFRELSLFNSLIVFGSSCIIIRLTYGRTYFIIWTCCYSIGGCLKMILSCGLPYNKTHFLLRLEVFEES